jgi:DNA mismatch repair ATPase MutS
VSSFYAELIRIKNLLAYIKDDMTPVLFFLDEILKGTNSLDRHLGSQALLQQLTAANAIGLVSTHDLELGKMADDSETIKNFSFNSYLKGKKLKFDYRLKPGICESFNASLLMAAMGINIDPDNN